MSSSENITTARIEAFSDGVIAILITIMVFDLKVDEPITTKNVWQALLKLSPKFVSYIISFLTMAIMWVNHHHLFHQIKHTNSKLLWYSINLLFWMSLIPFATNFIGQHPFAWQACFVYGMVFFMCAISFTLLRIYAIKKDLIQNTGIGKILIKNYFAIAAYLLGACISVISVYIAYILYITVPIMYFLPDKHYQTNN